MNSTGINFVIALATQVGRRAEATHFFDALRLEWAVLFIAVFIAVASVCLQWHYFKRNNPFPCDKAAAQGYWRRIFWREVRATFLLASISFGMVVATVCFFEDSSLVAIASLLFWNGMFFYNLWLAQWYTWRINTNRRR